MKPNILRREIIVIIFFFSIQLFSQTSVGSGSYTTSHPGVDAAGRNAYPSGTPFVTGNAQNRPIPTNDWWSKLIKEGQADNLFNYPLTLKTTREGLILTYIPWGVIGDSQPIKVGLDNLNSNNTMVSDYSDWTVSMNWRNAEKQMTATAGIGMPFVYFEKSASEDVVISIQSGQVTVREELLIIENASNGADFVVYAPSGSTWSNNGNVYRSSLGGKTYWSIAMLPEGNSSIEQKANDYKNFAYVFPTNTSVDWEYDSTQGKVSTTFSISTEVKEGIYSAFLQGLLPHQWSHLSQQSQQPSSISYSTVRGEMKMLEGNTFTVENNFSGILSTLPNLSQYSSTYNPAELIEKIKVLENSQLDLWTDSYNEGQLMNRLIQTARAANEIGLIESRDKIISTIKDRLENWLTYTAGEKAFLFYYNATWSTMIGYPAGHGQDSNINDHHFHWGYFIHAAAFLEQFQPGWVDQWGPMINLLIRDAASQNRSDDRFPFLRNFSPFAGHSWANGFASFPQGNDQESTSESMQFNSALIHYGTLTGQDDIRDLGIYLYTTEQSAIEEYWFDTENRNFQPNQNYGLVSRVWGNSYDNGTFWTSDITASYGIEFYPIHGGSFYLATNQNYASNLWSEIESNTEILSPNSQNPNLWYDTFWKYLAFTNPARALELYGNSPNRNLKFGVSDAHTYYWLHNLESIGVFQPQIRADYPISSVFDKDGNKTYVVHNYGSTPINVSFTDGFNLTALPNQITTNRDLNVSGVLETDFNQSYPNSTISLRLNETAGDISKVVFYRNGSRIGTSTIAPYAVTSNDLPVGNQQFWARIYTNESEYELSNILTIQVGEQEPFGGNRHILPGTIEAGNYDVFQGGKGQNISYLDMSSGNNADYRTNEDVDAGSDNNEGKTVGWIDAGEWLEYSIDVQQSGVYSVALRYASGNATGGGPFYFKIYGENISPNILLNRTSSENWDTWQTKTVQSIELTAGEHVLRAYFENGGFNLGRMTFNREGDLPYAVPTANAGENVVVILPNTSTTLNGSLSSDNGAGTLSYDWEQLYGPNRVSIQNSSDSNPRISNLVTGIYSFQLRVSAGNKTTKDQVYVIVNETGNHPPSVRLKQPLEGNSFRENDNIILEATVGDLDGSVSNVFFYKDNEQIAEINESPFVYTWENVASGAYTIKAKAVDDQGEETLSSPVNIRVDEVVACSQNYTQAQQGQFSSGYTATFETVGNSVNVSFELLDTDKSGVVAWLWQENPFQEFELAHQGDRVFSRTISGVEQGQTLSFACKFAYAGGMSVTRYIQYVVGSDCSGIVPDAPDNGNEDENEEGETSTISNTLCSGQSREATQGSFSQGFNYEFIPSSNQLTVRFELLDNQSGVIAYLWKDNPFRESSMNAIGDKHFEASIDLARGETVQFACKFAFAGGLAVTKYFTFTMGQNCGQSPLLDDEDQDGVSDSYDQCPNTSIGAYVNQNGCEVFYLPPSNFNVSKMEKCEGNNSILISVDDTDYTYNVAVSGAVTLNDSFSESNYRIDELANGQYTICITVAGVPQSEFERCYTVLIEAVQPLSISAFKETFNETINFSLHGGQTYYITHNQTTTQTQNNSIRLKLVKGNNRFTIKTAKSCQGIFETTYFNSNAILLAPNPIKETLYVYVGGEDREVELSIFTNEGRVFHTDRYSIDENRVVKLDVSQLQQGSYVLKAVGETLNVSELLIKE